MQTPVIPTAQFLSQMSPFSVLPLVELQRLAGLVATRTYAKGQTIYTEGESADFVWILQHGRVDIFKYSAAGRPLAIETIKPKELFGILCLVGSHDKNYPCTAVVATPSTILRMPHQTFVDLTNCFPAMIMGVCSLCSVRLNELQASSFHWQEKAEKKIARALLQLSKSEGRTLLITRHEIANLAGITTETSIRIISAFSKKGWVSSLRGQVILRNPIALEKLLRA